jgi:hypothetical protein
MGRAWNQLLLVISIASVGGAEVAGQYALDLSQNDAFAGFAGGGGYLPDVVPFNQGGTIETWVFPEAELTGEPRVIASSENDYWLFFTDDGVFAARLELGAGNYVEYGTGPGTIELGKWQHIAFTYDQSSAKFYVDGQLIAHAVTVGGPIWGAHTIQFGCWSFAPNDQHFLFMRGLLDNTRVWSSVRAEAEILATMMIENVSDPSLIASWTWEQTDLDLVSGLVCPLSPGAGYVAPGALDPVGEWLDLGNALAGTAGLPSCEGTGFLAGNDPIALNLANARAFAPSWLVLGLSDLSAPFKGGVLVPMPDLPLAFTTDGFGEAELSALWPPGVPSGESFWSQWWVQDPVGPKGFAASNALKATTP